jgi:hypothetical protein
MQYSFLETATETLHEKGLQFTVREEAQLAGSERKQRKEFKAGILDPWMYRGYFGARCPGCETPAGKRHLKNCAFAPVAESDKPKPAPKCKRRPVSDRSGR